MLESVDLKAKLTKDEYRQRMSPLEIRLGELQRQARELGIPVIVVFEGWDAAGKGTLINRLMLCLDARGFNVHPTHPATEEEAMRPFLWRFWRNTPARGRIAIFDRSWYDRVLAGRVDRRVKKSVWERAYREIRSFEEQFLADDAVIVKFFLHISKAEQKKRFRILEKDEATAWRVTREDWQRHRQYEKYQRAVEDMLARTSTALAPWTLVAAQDRRMATVTILETVIGALERKAAEVTDSGRRFPRVELPPLPGSVLGQVDLSQSLAKEEYESELKVCQRDIRELEHEAYRHRLPVVILYEGWDAAGKGGNIRRLVQGLDPRGYEVVPIAAPNVVEKQHHYLWRFWLSIPKAGHIAIFDRSWYGRVMVERLEGFCREDEWHRAYNEINEFERQMADAGTVIVKFWLHIDQDEQLRRFKDRQQTPWKQWKITDEDWRNREKYQSYYQAVDEMIARTSTACAPWTVIPATDKRFARITALRTVIAAIRNGIASKDK
jgi:polyphosphate kinase 2 (PPK2 family)